VFITVKTKHMYYNIT